MIGPTPRLVAVAALGLPLAALPALGGGASWIPWVLHGAAVAALAVLDALRIQRPAALGWSLDVPERILLGDPASGRITLREKGGERPLRAEVRVEADPDLAPSATFPAVAEAGGAVRIDFPLAPRRRGTHRVRSLWIRWTGPLGLVRDQARKEVGRPVAVLPNLGTVRTAALRFFGSPESRAGSRVERFLGDGTEFESLREFAPGFDTRSLHWRSSARHRRLMVRMHRAERDHQVVLALDTGRLMGEPIDGIPRLDHAVTAALLLAYVGIRTGDRVGLFAFDGAVRVREEPAGGRAAFARLRARTAELDYGTEETNFTLGLTDLLTRLRRRSLVVVFTDFADSISAELMAENLGRLARRHFVLLAALRDAELAAVERAEPRDLETLHRAVVAGDLAADRARVLGRLRRAGVSVVDVPPGPLGPALVRRYLEIKRREMV